MAGPIVSPDPVGTVTDLVGVHMRGKIALPPGATSVSGFEIEVAHRATPDVALVHLDGEPILPVVGPRAFQWISLNGCPAHQGMKVDLRRPPVRIRVSEPIKDYSWRLTQNGHAVEERVNTTSGLSEDGRCIDIVPKRPLIREGRLPVGFFFPPFAVLDTAPHAYIGQTYGPGVVAGSPGHHAYAVDFNRGAGPQNRGDPVLATQAGTVIFVDRSVDGHGTVWICHRGNYMTQYTHMTDIPDRFGPDGSKHPCASDDPHLRVRLGEQIGQIGDVGSEGAFHLHYRQHKGKTADGQWIPVKMRFGGRPYDASIAPAGPRPPNLDDWRSDRSVTSRTPLKGWPDHDRTATYFVTVRFPDDQVIRKRLHFSLAAAHTLPDCADTGCGEDPPLPLDDVYDGPVLAAGDYSIRYRCTDDTGVTGPWAVDASVVVAPAVPRGVAAP